jgi:hypothetical protein
VFEETVMFVNAIFVFALKATIILNESVNRK